MILEKLEPGHLRELSVLSEEYIAALCGHEGYAGFEAGRLVGAAGMVTNWRGCMVAWALLMPDVDMRTMVKATKEVQRFLAGWTCRVETWVDASRPDHVMWAEKLGFEKEGLMRKFLPDGGDAWLYARV